MEGALFRPCMLPGQAACSVPSFGVEASSDIF